MLYLLLSIFFNAILFVIIKLFAKFNINTLQALVINYLVAFSVGFFMLKSQQSIAYGIQEKWFLGSVFLGFIFISTFYVTALTSQKNGLSVASVASKMSVIIPIIAGYIFYKENLGILKIIGIVIALLSVYLTAKKETGKISNSSELIFPALVFLGAGIIDSAIQYIQNFYVPTKDVSLFSMLTFLCAFLVGILLLFFLSFKKKLSITGKTILGGIALGIPNFFSLYFMIKMLASKIYPSAVTFTIHNIAIVAFTTLIGVAFFNEKMSKQNIIGITLSIIALLFVTQN